jgi:hypothetical protein
MFELAVVKKGFCSFNPKLILPLRDVKMEDNLSEYWKQKLNLLKNIFKKKQKDFDEKFKKKE